MPLTHYPGHGSDHEEAPPSKRSRGAAKESSGISASCGMDVDIFSNESLTAEGAKRMKVAELKTELKSRGLSIKGNKPELLTRLCVSL